MLDTEAHMERMYTVRFRGPTRWQREQGIKVQLQERTMVLYRPQHEHVAEAAERVGCSPSMVESISAGRCTDRILA